MSYQPIENYGIVGNMRTVALVGMNGSIDWYCYPHFDSPSVFGAILDDKKGGRFQISADMNGARSDFERCTGWMSQSTIASFWSAVMSRTGMFMGFSPRAIIAHGDAVSCLLYPESNLICCAAANDTMGQNRKWAASGPEPDIT